MLTVKTKAPLFIGTKAVANFDELYSGIDASSSSSDILSFQQWYNTQNPNNQILTDGIWGPQTSSAWNSSSDAYLKFIAPKGVLMSSQNTGPINLGNGLYDLNAPANTSTPVSTPVTPVSTPVKSSKSYSKNNTSTPPSTENKSEHTVAKEVAGMDLTTKLVLGAVGVVIVAAIVTLVIKRNKK